MKDRAISLNAAIEAIYSCAVGGKEYIENAPMSDHFAEGLYDAVSAIEDLPSVTPQPKTGHWIEGKYRDDDIRYNDSSYKCDKCGRIVDFKENSCPNCGARMGDSQERSDKEK